MRLAKDIDVDVLLRGTGTQEHQRELYKLLAVANVSTEDLKDANTMQMIQEVLTDFIADDEMGEEELEFTARALAFRATEGQRSTRDRKQNAERTLMQRNKHRESFGVDNVDTGRRDAPVIPQTVTKKVAFSELVKEEPV